MTPQPDASLVVRMAIRVGAAVGRWQRRRAARRDDALVEKWKAAWAKGRDARRAGIPQEKAPHRGSSRRAAWLAGWQWAEQQAITAGGSHDPGRGVSQAATKDVLL